MMSEGETFDFYPEQMANQNIDTKRAQEAREIVKKKKEGSLTLWRAAKSSSIPDDLQKATMAVISQSGKIHRHGT
jgi:hypothetical protein